MADEQTTAGKETPTPGTDGAAADGTTPAEGTAAAADGTTTTTQTDASGTGDDGDGTQPTPRVIPDTYALTLPDGSPFEESDLAGFAAEATAMKLTQDEAQAMVEARAAQIAQVAATYLTELQADPELGGAKLDETKVLAAKGRDVFAPPGTEEAALLNGWFERTGLGNHKLLVRAFVRLGRLTSEDRVGLPAGTATGAKVTRAQKLYGTD